MLLFANNATSQLASAINSSTTTITVATGRGALYPAPSGGNYFLATLEEAATREIVKVTSRSGDVFTVVRAQEGTTAQSFSTSAIIDNRLTAGALNAVLAQLLGDQHFQGRIGIGVAPAAPLHVNGEIRMETTTEQNLSFNFLGTMGTELNPSFRLGRMVSAGEAIPEFRFLYYSDTLGFERNVFAIESDGTTAVIGDGIRRSHYEAYYQDGTFKPVMRLSSWPHMQLELGAGGTNASIGHATRSSNVVTVQTDQPHDFSQGDFLFIVTNGDPKFTDTEGTIAVASVIDDTHFTYNDTGSNGSNTVAMSYSIETDLIWRRAGTNHLQLVMGPGTGDQLVKVEFFADAMTTAAGYGVSYGGSVLYPPTLLTNADSPYALVAGSVYLCDASAGPIDFNLADPTSYFGKPGRTIEIKKTDSSANPVTINGPVEGASSLVLGSQYKYAKLLSDGASQYLNFGSN